MKTKHHIPSAILSAYSTGSLPEAFSIIVACHISLCDQCRAEAEAFDTIGGALIDNEEIADIDLNSFEQTMKLIEKQNNNCLAPSKKSNDVYPTPLKNYFGGSVENIKWKSVGGGIKQAIIVNNKNASARLLSIPPGAQLPDHSHKGLEMTMVLQGSFSDEIDTFHRGDVELGDDHLTHTPKAGMDEHCICIAATQAPLIFNSWLPKLLQPFIRI